MPSNKPNRIFFVSILKRLKLNQLPSEALLLLLKRSGCVGIKKRFGYGAVVAATLDLVEKHPMPQLELADVDAIDVPDTRDVDLNFNDLVLPLFDDVPLLLLLLPPLNGGSSNNNIDCNSIMFPIVISGTMSFGCF